VAVRLSTALQPFFPITSPGPATPTTSSPLKEDALQSVNNLPEAMAIRSSPNWVLDNVRLGKVCQNAAVAGRTRQLLPANIADRAEAAGLLDRLDELPPAQQRRVQSVRRAASGPAGRDRDTLPHACAAWGIDLRSFRVGDQELWPTYGRLWNLRHGFVHRGEELSEHDASLAISCVRVLIEGPLTDLVTRLDLHWPEKPWLLDWDEAKDPFERKR